MDEEETLILRVNLQDHPHVIPIYAGEPPEPIEPDWAGITSWRSAGRESFNLVFYKSEGALLEYLPFDTLDIALDQAEYIAGITRTVWEPCEIDVGDSLCHPADEPGNGTP